MKRVMKIFVLCVLCASAALSGCTVVTQDQKNWIADKANRSGAYVLQLDAGKTTADQDKEWIRSQNESWKLWAAKVQLGLAAPSFLVNQSATQPANR